MRLTIAPTGNGTVKACDELDCDGRSFFYYDDNGSTETGGFVIECREDHTNGAEKCSSGAAADTERIRSGISVRLEATPDSNTRLAGWAGCTENPRDAMQCFATMDELTTHRVVRASFVPDSVDHLVMTLNWFAPGDLDISVSGPSDSSCQVERQDSGADASPVHGERARCSNAGTGLYEVGIQNLSASEQSYTLSVEVVAGGASVAVGGYPVQATLPATSGRTHRYTHP